MSRVLTSIEVAGKAIRMIGRWPITETAPDPESLREALGWLDLNLAQTVGVRRMFKRLDSTLTLALTNGTQSYDLEDALGTDLPDDGVQFVVRAWLEDSLRNRRPVEIVTREKFEDVSRIEESGSPCRIYIDRQDEGHTLQIFPVPPASSGFGTVLATATSGMTLSNDDLTATKTGSDALASTALSQTTRGATKVYAEVHVDLQGIPNDTVVGIAPSTFPASATVGIGDTATSFGWLGGNGQLFTNGLGSAFGVTPPYLTGHWLAVAVDRDAQTVSFRNITTASAWSGPHSIAAVGDIDWALGVTLYDAGDSETVNFDDDFVGTPPDGYTRWGGLSITGPAVWSLKLVVQRFAPDVSPTGVTGDTPGNIAHGFGQAWQRWVIFQLAHDLGCGAIHKLPEDALRRYAMVAEAAKAELLAFENREQDTEDPICAANGWM
jgi:hypothetical protein